MKSKLSNILAPNDTVLFAYLFGSCAEGAQREDSDVDIAVYLSNTSLDTKLSLHHNMEKELGKEVDLVVLNEVKNIYLLEAILHKGLLLKEHELRAFFEVEKNHEIIDFKQFKRYIDAA